MARVARWLGVVLVGAIFATSLAIGCIRRYPAPTTAVEPEMPYSALVTWRGLTLPPQLDQPGDPLPERALRLAIGPTAHDVFADTSLVDEPEQGAVIDDDLEKALGHLAQRSEIVVVLVDKSLWPAGAKLCHGLRELGDRVRVAVGVSGHAQDGPEPRSAASGSRDPLFGVALEALCPNPSTGEGEQEHSAP